MAAFVATDDGFVGRFSGRIAAFPAPEVEVFVFQLLPGGEVVGARDAGALEAVVV